MASKDSYGFSHCPECKKWVPMEHMNYFDGLKVCEWCLNQTQEEPPHDKFIHDPYYGKIQCIMCDSYDTEEVVEATTLSGGRIIKYKCRECGEEFIL